MDFVIPKNYNNGDSRKGNKKTSFANMRWAEQRMAQYRKEKGIRFKSSHINGFYIKNDAIFIQNDWGLNVDINKPHSIRYCNLHVRNTITGHFHKQPYLLRKDEPTYVDDNNNIHLVNKPLLKHKKLRKDIKKYGQENFIYTVTDINKYDNFIDYAFADLNEYNQQAQKYKGVSGRYNRNINFDKNYEYLNGKIKKDFCTKIKNGLYDAVKKDSDKLTFNDVSFDTFNIYTDFSFGEGIDDLSGDIVINFGAYKHTFNAYKLYSLDKEYLKEVLKLCIQSNTYSILNTLQMLKSANLSADDCTGLITNYHNQGNHAVARYLEGYHILLLMQTEEKKENIVNNKSKSNFVKDIFVIINETTGRVHYVPQEKFTTLDEYIAKYGSREAKRCYNRGDVIKCYTYQCFNRKEYSVLAYECKYAKAFKRYSLDTCRLKSGQYDEKNIGAFELKKDIKEATKKVKEENHKKYVSLFQSKLFDQYYAYKNNLINEYNNLKEKNYDLHYVKSHLDKIYSDLLKSVKNINQYEVLDNHIEINKFVLSKFSVEQFEVAFINEMFQTALYNQKTFLKCTNLTNTLEEFSVHVTRQTAEDKRRELILTVADGQMKKTLPDFTSINKIFFRFKQPPLRDKTNTNPIDVEELFNRRWLTNVKGSQDSNGTSSAVKSYVSYAHGSVGNNLDADTRSCCMSNNDTSELIERQQMSNVIDGVLNKDNHRHLLVSNS